MVTDQQPKFLLVAFLPRLELVLTEELPFNNLILNGVPYRDMGSGDFTGFYDWLRSPGQKILGVRYCPFEDLRSFRDAVRQFSYINVTEDSSCVEVYFSSDRNVEPSFSGDQDFGNNKVFLSDHGEYLVTFDLDGLNDSDIKGLQDYGAVSKLTNDKNL